MPSPFASTPHRAQVDGMNCIQPMAPAELGPRLAPKFVSTLLMAPSTCQGMPYVAPAACQMPRRAPNDIGPLCDCVNAITGPLLCADGSAAARLACECATRNVSAAALPERVSATTTPSKGRSLLMATAGRRPGASEGPWFRRPLLPRPAPAPTPRRPAS